MKSQRRPAAGHGEAKFPKARLLATSALRDWRGLLVEQRAHPAGEIAAFTPTHTEVTMILDAHAAPPGEASVVRRGNGKLQQTPASPGSIWLCPAGIHEDRIRLTSALPEVLHVYLPQQRFAAVAEEHDLRWHSKQQIRYEAGLRDPLLEGIGRALQAELAEETPGGDMLAESLATGLVVRLMTRYGEHFCRMPRGPGALDHARLGRVFDFVEANLQNPISLESMAKCAALSEFHFIRAFKAATGQAPYQFVILRRLELAKALLRRKALPIERVAAACGFSTASSFCRAFAQRNGIAPGRYREQLR